MTKVKICGITTLEDALMAVEAGADALGFVFFEKSPRYIGPEAAARIIRELPPFVQVVGLFVNAELDFVNRTADTCGLDLVQLHGEESPAYCGLVRRRVMKAFRVRGAESLAALADYKVSAYLLDAYSPASHGGTGERFDWDHAVAAKGQGRIVLAGGLDPDNVAQAVAKVAPYAVDVSSGVELSPGRKDPEKVRRLIAEAKKIALI
ncbi:N-(5'-phosphoribosyl)anthranilate isomerase [Citrifermentans bemidjiense Bem]|uniref:N-(5'-phosphoribosyl)anthranilate isomerase n=1 Tax=Citrifermentans bemidjiense (strain ATCC BAA-1014 / DSM 16622 / JCM 12645 / Bem) TaxID=404380 RepID=TRPF_CITBB|nr:phosphoribosylanthranilate isomerase [Citrifermentans bemidjiense]B5EBV0.1 RecName: Full=N-(5'-phosphoribosyl)anthranilate isomerase; Short=PRAI [Citrifermentans bemidjiense Bem]ACH38974.1 N-(5'-phosphoribosyl)anthranilate isomerase [Citrifermentans bemidjiense Bem]